MKILLGLFMSWVLIGCGSPDPAATAERAERDRERREAAAERETVFDPMLSTMDRAKGVNDINQDRNDRLGDALEESDQ